MILCKLSVKLVNVFKVLKNSPLGNVNYNNEVKVSPNSPQLSRRIKLTKGPTIYSI